VPGPAVAGYKTKWLRDAKCDANAGIHRIFDAGAAQMLKRQTPAHRTGWQNNLEARCGIRP